ncbi:DEAD/DEAH box helicase [Alteribacter natronophilus]|uniref:DEAD/DEAH box helicase n=1 Tax=Alteribacter natronophilus TaxID=2583810 RepID=UPI001486C055|nr:DEAD/DEAH box helicase family protein [Alteribacter natronophilus]
MRFLPVNSPDHHFPADHHFLPEQPIPRGRVWPVMEPLVNSHVPAEFLRLPDIPVETLFTPDPAPGFEPDIRLMHMLKGRRLLLDELLPDSSLETIQKHFAKGFIRFTTGFTKDKQCRRCGANSPADQALFHCFRCRKHCTYCRKCIMMGRVSECSIFVTSNVPAAEDPKNAAHTLAWEGTLSPGQKHASDFLTNRLQNGPPGECLLWAVCGAGKTEMLFSGIQKALKSGKRVLVATPRSDVVRELEPRFDQAFPDTEIAAFYGGSSDRFADADLTISTTHQLLRFYRTFDAVIIDEVDAFPYTHEPMLHFAVENAAKLNSHKVYLTATPERRMQRASISGTLPSVIVPRRYHGYDLPVPRFVWTFRWRKKAEKQEIPAAVTRWLRGHLENEKQIFLFVPTVKLLKQILPAAQKQFRVPVESVYSEDPDRKEKVTRFRQGKTRLLLTTTILERGVTVKGVQVGVLGADDSRFTESALVQISGRAGRSPDEPEGDVCFFHDGSTKAMVRARQQIEAMNREREGISR